MRKFVRSVFVAIAIVSVLVGSTGCITTKSAANKPPRERISNIPHNMPASWEGSAQLGGMPTSY